jgi:DNA-binding response OmpR family regulator
MQRTILVVDDTPADIGMLVATLSEAGYRVHAAPSGDNALEQCRDEAPDLVLLDSRMPEMDGFETCRRLQQLPRLAQTPVIFMTALSQPQDKVHAFAAGGDDCLTRPFQYQEVLARVRLHLTLRALETDLEDLQRELEDRVAARTMELKAALEEVESLHSRLQQENDSLKEQLRECREAN